MDNENANEEELELKVNPDIDPAGDDGEGEPPEDDDPSTDEEKAYAQRLGWVPKGDWDDARAEKAGIRKPPVFLWARDYIAKTEDDRSLMRERLQRQDRQIQDLNGKLTEVHQVVISQRNMSIEAVKRARQQGIDEAEQRMRDAVASGEVADYDQAKKDRDDLLKTPAPEAPRQERTREELPAKDLEAERWVAANPWFNESYALQNAMIVEEDLVRKKNPGLNTSAVLDKAKAIVQRRYPELFGQNPRRDAPSSVSPPSGSRQSRTGFDALPQADKDAYEKQRKMFASMTGKDGKPIAYTKEEFMREYALA